MTDKIFQDNRRIQKIALVTGGALLVVKFLAFFLTSSNAILSDALESIVNVGAGAFGLFALRLSSRPRDYDHPYGHGKIEFLSAGFEGGLIFLAGIGIVGKSIYNFFDPQELTQLDLGILLAASAGLVNYILGFILERKGDQNKSIVLIAGGKHLKSDAYTSLGLILGLAVVLWTGYVWLDNIVAIVFGVIIIYTGYRVLRQSFAGIMDEQDPELIQDLVTNLNNKRQEDWIDLHNFRIIKYGSRLHIDCHLTIPWYYTVAQAHDTVEAFENTVIDLEENTLELFVHTDPCTPSSCKICQVKDCKVRQEPFTAKIEWRLQNVIENQKHNWNEEDK